MSMTSKFKDFAVTGNNIDMTIGIGIAPASDLALINRRLSVPNCSQSQI